MKYNTSALALALICASALGVMQVSAQEAKPSSPVDQLGFVGDGTCTGNVMAMGKKPGHATSGKYHGEKTLDGHWVAVRYDEDQTAAAPKPFHVVQYFGYDAAKKRYVTVLFENTEGSYSTGISAGWKGDSIAFDETTDGKTVSFRDVFTTSKSGMSSHTGWMKDKHGKWVKTDEENCKPS